MKQKGFTLIELLIALVIIGILSSIAVPAIFQFLSNEKIAQKTGSLVREFKQEVEPQVKTKTVIINKSDVKCQDGKKIIEIDGIIYYLGNIKNTWGDLAPVECQ